MVATELYPFVNSFLKEYFKDFFYQKLFYKNMFLFLFMSPGDLLACNFVLNFNIANNF